MNNKDIISNSLFYFSAFCLLLIICLNFSILYALATGITSFGTQVGGRILAVSPLGCQLPPPVGTGPDPVCVVAKCPPNPSQDGITITPYGYSAVGICPIKAMPTTFGPISPASTGWQILGLFTVATPMAVPIGLVGASP